MRPSSSEAGTALRTVAARYDRNARLYDLCQSPGEWLGITSWRRQLWRLAPAEGRILEVGVGTGLNMPFYPPRASVVAIDISERMLARAHARALRAHVPVQLALMDVQRLDFLDASFDCVVATFVFCSVPDPVAGLREVQRVLKPGGTLLLLEHVRSGNPLVGKLMDWLNPLAVRITGANINRRTVDNVRRAGFDDIRVEDRLRGLVRLIAGTRSAGTG